jgi:DNA polymerase III alpha subunit
MINLRNRTEYSFREVYGPIDKVIAACGKEEAIGICDRHGTWGHVEFSKACKKAGKKPILGVELAVVEDMNLREKQGVNFMNFLPMNNKGLQELYALTTLATEHNYYHPRIDYGVLFDLSDDIIILSGSSPVWGSLPKRDNLIIEINPTVTKKSWDVAQARGFDIVATGDNFYPRSQDEKVYEVVAGRNRHMRTSPMNILDDYSWARLFPFLPEEDRARAIQNTYAIADLCNAQLGHAELPHFKAEKSLEQMCIEGAIERHVDLATPVYAARLRREIDMIAEKGFADYFYIVWDLIKYAKQHMLVGPARGSSCGSLVCYLLRITDIDPIPYDLLFERFIDINRKDLPDIDIDFQDDRREMVFEYLRQTYGQECVARIGSIMRYKAKSAIGDIAKELNIPAWEVADLKNAMIERSGGDSRASFCILDTFNEIEVGRKTLEKYPQLKIAADVENHARQSGQHAAGVIITSKPLANYCSVDKVTGAAMIDKKDAEALDLLKVDALGLRTLSVLQDVLDQVGWTREQLVTYPTDDAAAFEILNKQKFAGIFQFEGYALQSIVKQIKVENFEDITSLTAIARPGPLISGGAAEWTKRRIGDHPTAYMHALCEPMTKVTYGIVIYQEQVMQIAREVGQLSWEDVSSLRKAMSKSLGKEFFDQYWVRFEKGAASLGVSPEDAKMVWENINTMGSWSFNRSHAVAYAMVSYWCVVLKSKFPLEFAAACLRNARDDDQCIRLLRELYKEGFKYKSFDPDKSDKNWSVQDGELIGGLTSIKGVGEKVAEDIINRRSSGQPYTARQKNLLANGTTPYDQIFECHDKFGHIRADPSAYKINTPIADIEQIDSEFEGEVVIFGRLKEKNLRDHNETILVQKRNGRQMSGQTLFLNLTVEDDTGTIQVTIDRHKYLRIGSPIVEEGKLGDWFLWKGKVQKGFRRLYVERWRKLEGTEKTVDQGLEK